MTHAKGSFQVGRRATSGATSRCL